MLVEITEERYNQLFKMMKYIVDCNKDIELVYSPVGHSGAEYSIHIDETVCIINHNRWGNELTYTYEEFLT